MLESIKKLNIDAIRKEFAQRLSELIEDALYKAKREIEHLLCEVSRLQSRIEKLVDTIQWEIKDWNEAMDTGHRKETYESIKRRISGLRGAILFEGVISWDKVDNLKER